MFFDFSILDPMSLLAGFIPLSFHLSINFFYRFHIQSLILVELSAINPQ